METKTKTKDYGIRLETFKDICVNMYEASDFVEFDTKDNIVYKNNYAKVILLVLQTKHKNLIKIDGITLEEIGYLFNVTRERIRQEEEGILGTPKSNTKGKTRDGKILSPNFRHGFKNERDKVNFILDLKDSMLLGLDKKPSVMKAEAKARRKQ